MEDKKLPGTQKTSERSENFILAPQPANDILQRGCGLIVQVRWNFLTTRTYLVAEFEVRSPGEAHSTSTLSTAKFWRRPLMKPYPHGGEKLLLHARDMGLLLIGCTIPPITRSLSYPVPLLLQDIPQPTKPVVVFPTLGPYAPTAESELGVKQVPPRVLVPVHL